MKFWIVTAAVLAAFSLPVSVRPATSAEVLVATGSTTVGVTVSLYAWPPNTVLQHLQHGQAVPRRLLSSTTVGATGTYTLRVGRAALAAAVASGDYDNLEIDAGATSWFFVENATAPAMISRHLSASPQGTCTGWTWYKGLKNAWGTVGQSYVLHAAHGTTQSFTYEAGQSSTLGVGESVTTPGGGFSDAGTSSVSTTAEQDFPVFVVAKVLDRTEFQMAEYTQSCGPIAKISAPAPETAGKKKSCNPVINDCTYYKVQSVGWAGGGIWKFPKSAPAATHCVVEKHGEGFHTDNETAVTWSAGLNIPQVGFSASAQTGYDHSARVSFRFKGRETVQLCVKGQVVVPAGGQLEVPVPRVLVLVQGGSSFGSGLFHSV